MEAYPLGAVSKAIKAVTYHGLRIHESVRGWEVEIVFDV
jgi:SHS2 domain-containing protein